MCLCSPRSRKGGAWLSSKPWPPAWPPVATDIPVFREFLDGDQALLVPPSDQAALSQAMLATGTDRTLRRRLTLEGRKVAERYAWDACARQHIALYERFTEAARQAVRRRAQGTTG